MQQQYSPAQVVEKTGFSLDTLRYYEKIGLLERITRNASGQRRFTQDDIGWLDMPVDEIEESPGPGPRQEIATGAVMLRIELAQFMAQRPAPDWARAYRGVLDDLRSAPGAFKSRKRVGRGHGSGHVMTAGKGTKGQKSRSGVAISSPCGVTRFWRGIGR
jgi:hypothetical protein